MATRREFLKGAASAGIVFCGCDMLPHARAQQRGRQSLPVMVNGKRVKTIDVHSHCATQVLSDEEKAAILGGNAARLFGMTG